MTGTLSVGGTHSDTTKELYVNGDAKVTATLDVGTDASVGGAMTLSDTLDVSGVTTLSNTVKLPTTYSFLTHTAGTAGALKISSDLGYVEVEDIRFIGNSIGVNGAADLIGLTSSDVTLKGDLKINDGTNDMFAVSVLTGDTQVGGALHVASDLNVGSGPTFQVTASDGSLAIGSNVFTVSGTSGNTKTLGKLAVNGAAPSLTTKELYVNGDIEATETLVVGGNVGIGNGVFTVNATQGDTSVLGKLDVSGDVDVNSQFKVDSSNGNTIISGTLDVTGDVTLSADLIYGGDLVVGANLFTVTRVRETQIFRAPLMLRAQRLLPVPLMLRATPR